MSDDEIEFVDEAPAPSAAGDAEKRELEELGRNIRVGDQCIVSEHPHHLTVLLAIVCSCAT